jgi:HEXXH motif-containing protein
MNLRYHQLPKDLFDSLAAEGGEPDAVRELCASQYSKHVLLLRSVLAAAEAAGHYQAPLARRGYDLLAAAQHHDPAAADAVIRHPSVGVWAHRTVRALSGGQALSGAEPGGLCAVAAAAAIRAGLPAEIEVPVIGGRVMLPSLGAAVVDGGTALVRSGLDGAEVTSGCGPVEVPREVHQDAPGWWALRRVRAGSFEVLIDDLDPFRMPASTNAASRLGAAEINTWEAVFREAWSLLERHHPVTAMEVAAVISVMVPLTPAPSGHISSNSPEAFGALALSEPPDPCTFAETFAHEVQHHKLSALVNIVDLTGPDDGRRFYAPWRDDPRPISGLLQGAYAHLGVSGFWRRQRHLEDGAARIRACAEFTRWRAATARVVQTMRLSGQLTTAGLDFIQGMERTLSRWADDPVPAEALTLACHDAEEHLTRWRSNNRPVSA